MDGPFPSERSQSFEYAGDNGYVRAQPQRKGFRGTEENAKTKLCMRWMAGDCRFGPRCNFAHGEHELRKMPPKPGRYSHDIRDRDMDKDLMAPVDAHSYGGYSSASFDGGYRSLSGQRPVSTMYSPEHYGGVGGGSAVGGGNVYTSSHGSTGGGGGGGYTGHLYTTAGSPNVGYGQPTGPTLVQPSGPLHVAATTPSARDYYASQPAYPVVGPNGWLMYRDPKSGEPYYHNHQLTITQWKRPDEWPHP